MFSLYVVHVDDYPPKIQASHFQPQIDVLVLVQKKSDENLRSVCARFSRCVNLAHFTTLSVSADSVRRPGKSAFSLTRVPLKQLPLATLDWPLCLSQAPRAILFKTKHTKRAHVGGYDNDNVKINNNADVSLSTLLLWQHCNTSVPFYSTL